MTYMYDNEALCAGSSHVDKTLGYMCGYKGQAYFTKSRETQFPLNKLSQL